MITRATRIQLAVFAVITLLGATYVGGRYAQVDRLVISRTYPVTIQLHDSGGIFEKADVTFRGISVGRVGEVRFNDEGVQVRLDIENDAPKISTDVIAVVANKSAIGEQFVDLQPQTAKGPYLAAGSRIPVDRTRVPISTTEFLVNLDRLIGDVDPGQLHTVVDELGTAFADTGDDLGAILDNTSLLLGQASANLGVTRQLIANSSTVLRTQIDSGSYIRAFARDLGLLSDTLVASDADIRTLVGPGSSAIADVNAIVSQNSADLSGIIANLRGPTEDLAAGNVGLEAVLVLYPYQVESTFTVLTPTADGNYNAAFGLVGGALGAGSILPVVCAGDQYRDRRDPRDITDYDAHLGAGFDPQFYPDCADADLIPRRPENTTYLPRSASGTLDGSAALRRLLLGQVAAS